MAFSVNTLQGEKVTFETFSRWLGDHPNAFNVSQWLLQPSGNLSLVNKLDTPTFYQTLAGVTHLEEQEIVELEKRFWTLSGSSTSGQVDMNTIRPMVSPPLPAVLVRNAWENVLPQNVEKECLSSVPVFLLRVRREPGRPHRLQGALVRGLSRVQGARDGEAEM